MFKLLTLNVRILEKKPQLYKRPFDRPWKERWNLCWQAASNHITALGPTASPAGPPQWGWEQTALMEEGSICKGGPLHLGKWTFRNKALMEWNSACYLHFFFKPSSGMQCLHKWEQISFSGVKMIPPNTTFTPILTVNFSLTRLQDHTCSLTI